MQELAFSEDAPHRGHRPDVYRRCPKPSGNEWALPKKRLRPGRNRLVGRVGRSRDKATGAGNRRRSRHGSKRIRRAEQTHFRRSRRRRARRKTSHSGPGHGLSRRGPHELDYYRRSSTSESDDRKLRRCSKKQAATGGVQKQPGRTAAICRSICSPVELVHYRSTE